jgi:hypothetical protein
VDHRLVREGYLDRISLSAAALYLFLVTAADAQGLSYYSDVSLCRRLRLSAEALVKIRAELVGLNLIAFEKPMYQVLQIEPVVFSPSAPPEAQSCQRNREPEPFPREARRTPTSRPLPVKEIFRRIMEDLS